MDKIDVLLVDGVGQPRIMTVAVALLAPTVIPYEHPRQVKGETTLFVHFDRMKHEVDATGRHVYRQRGTGSPAIRWHRLTGAPTKEPPAREKPPRPQCNDE